MLSTLKAAVGFLIGTRAPVGPTAIRVTPISDEQLDVIFDWPTIADAQRLVNEVRRLNAKVAELESKLNGAQTKEADGSM